jgi:hypothetical protein
MSLNVWSAKASSTGRTSRAGGAGARTWSCDVTNFIALLRCAVCSYTAMHHHAGGIAASRRSTVDDSIRSIAYGSDDVVERGKVLNVWK